MVKNYGTVNIDSDDLKEFINKLNSAGKGRFRKDLLLFLEGIGVDFLRVVQDEIINKDNLDSRLLIKSFDKDSENNIFILNRADMSVEVGTNVDYASYVNDGHWLNPKGVDKRFVPGHWDENRFIYEPGANTGMMLKQHWIEGSHYFDGAVHDMERMIPIMLEEKLQQWAEEYFEDFL